MGMTDPIADLLTRIRNASSVNHDKVIIPASNLKLRVVNLLVEEGFVRNFKVIKDGLQDSFVCTKSTMRRSPSDYASGANLIPGCRAYVQAKLPRVRSGWYCDFIHLARCDVRRRHGLYTSVVNTSVPLVTDTGKGKKMSRIGNFGGVPTG